MNILRAELVETNRRLNALGDNASEDGGALAVNEIKQGKIHSANFIRLNHTINRAAFVCLSVCLFPISSEVL